MSEPFLGEIRMFGFSRTPEGWQACDGSLLSIAQNDALYTLLGTTYGGDGVNTFGVPDLRGQIPVHQGAGTGLTPRVLGGFGGSESVTLTPNQIPAHTHGFSATTLAASAAAPGANLELGAVSGDTLYATDLSVSSVGMSPTCTTPDGGSQPHDNLMPTLTVQYCIATAGIFPQQS